MGRGRGVSYGGGHSSLDYLFGGGGGEASKPAPVPVPEEQRPPRETAVVTAPAPAAAEAAPPPKPKEDTNKGVPAGVRGNQSQTNNYFRAQGQNCGNFLTDRPSTKVHAAPGGGSSLDYLFGGSGK